jgi:hypothetical protein
MFASCPPFPLRHFSRSAAARLPRCLLLFALAMAIAPLALAQRRDFPATYRITNVSTQDNQVQLTLSLTVRNFSGADIQDGVIVLYASDPHSDPIGEVGRIKLLSSYADSTVSRSFTVSEAEYTRWQQGLNPRLYLLVPDDKAGTRLESIDPRRENLPAN